MSLCTSLKGHLQSRFLVLSDDRILPPYQPKGNKRSHPDDNSQDTVPVKRTNQAPNSRPPSVAGVSGIQSHVPVAAAFNPSLIYLPQNLASVVGAQGTSSIPTMVAHGVGGVPGVSSIPSVVSQLPMFSAGAMSFPPPQVVPIQVAHPAAVQSTTAVSVATSQSPGYKTVTRRGKGKGPANSKNQGAVKTAPGQVVLQGRVTPSHVAKSKKSTAQVTSPGPDQYESCVESGDETGEACEALDVQDVQE